MITAQQAAEMAGPKAEEYLAFIEKKLLSLQNQEHEVIIRDTPYCDWLYGSNKSNPDEVKNLESII